MNAKEIKQLITQYKNKVDMKLCSSDYAKGYCYGVVGSSEQISEDEYNELSKMIDDVFDRCEKLEESNMDAAEMRKELNKIKGLGDVTINRIVEHFTRKELLSLEQQYCYSWDGEDYSNGLFDTKAEAYEYAMKDNPDAEELYIGIATKPKLRWISNEEHILESMREDLRENCGEYGSEGLDITTEQEIDLGNMIDAAVQEWIEKHNIKPTCYSVTEVAHYEFNEKTCEKDDSYLCPEGKEHVTCAGCPLGETIDNRQTEDDC